MFLEVRGQGEASHTGGGVELHGKLQFQLVASHTGTGLLNVVIQRTFHSPWANTIPVDSITSVHGEGHNAVIAYAREGQLSIRSKSAPELRSGIASIQSKNATDAGKRTSTESDKSEVADADAEAPSISASSSHWAGAEDRFERLWRAGFGDDEAVRRASAQMQMDPLEDPPSYVENTLQSQASQYTDAMTPEHANAFGPVFYTCMRQGWSASSSTFRARFPESIRDAPEPEHISVFMERLTRLVPQWFEVDRTGDLSDLAFYQVSNEAPRVRSLVQAAIQSLSPNTPLPSNWAEDKDAHIILWMARNAVFFGVATFLADTGIETI